MMLSCHVYGVQFESHHRDGQSVKGIVVTAKIKMDSMVLFLIDLYGNRLVAYAIVVSGIVVSCTVVNTGELIVVML